MKRAHRDPLTLLSALALLVASAGLALPSSPAAVAATAGEPTAAAALRWRLVGPFRGGRVLATAGIPGDPATFYFGSVAGGVWKSTNAGVTWEPLFDDQPIASVGALAVAPSDPETIYVGTGEADMRSDISFGDGVYRSTDGGRTWHHVGLDDTRHIGKVLVDPRDPRTVLVAALGHAYGPNEERGVFRTTDGGATWEKVLYKDAHTGAVDLVADPGDPRVVWATLWQARRTPWSQYPPDQGPGGGLWRSDDGGVSWHEVRGGGLPAGPFGRIGVAAAPGGRRVYALVDAAEGAGLYRSEDAGKTWERVGTDPRLTGRGWYFGRVFVDPKDPDTVYVPNRSLLRSTDGGHSFTVIKGAPGGDDYHYLWIDPQEPRRMIVGSDQGASVSLDRGRTWSSWYNQPTAQLYRGVTDHGFPYRLYGTQQDSGSVSIASRSNNGEITFRDWYSVGAGESGYIAPDPADPDIVYGGDVGARVFRFDRRTGQAQDISPWPVPSWGTPVPAMRYRWTWTSPLVLDPLEPDALYLGTQVVLRSTDGGLHWQEASPDLTGARPGEAKAEGPPTVADARERGYGVVFTIAPSPVEHGVIWAGTDTGLVQLTTDGGHHWRDVTPEELPPWSKVTLVEASPFDAATAYAAVDRHRLDDLAPYLYRTHDSGAHWTRIDRGIEPPAYVHTVRADPERRGLLYAGTETGVYVSFDEGDRWQPLQRNLPTTSVRDLAIEAGDLVAATHGRSFWILDDLAPLRQWNESIRGEEAHLFAPRAAVRVRRSVARETPLPPEIPHGENPPAGAILDYWLKEAPAGPVVLEIRDAGGRLVRRFSSGEPPAPPAASAAEPPYFADEWLPRPEPLPAEAGMNRFVWDLRYPSPPVLSPGYSIAAIAGRGTVALPQGPLVVPGRYEVRLTAGGHTLEQPLEVRPDPRGQVAPEAFAAQLDLAVDIWNATAANTALHADVSGLSRALAGLPEDELEGPAAAALAALRTRLETLGKGMAASPLPGLLEVAESADREPTAAAREAFEQARTDLERQRETWEEVRSRDLPALDTLLGAQGIAPLEPPPSPPPATIARSPR